MNNNFNSNQIKFDFNDISLIPTMLSNIRSRNDINIFDENGKLPIFVSPMDTVVSDDNYNTFIDAGLYVCMPRKNPQEPKIDYPDECFISFSLDEIEELVRTNCNLPKRCLIDVANAHSIRVYEISKLIKETCNIELMIGNIANPETYGVYAQIGVDYIRTGIGAGHSCTTSANSSIHFPMGSLIKECSDIKEIGKYKTKIIADGGFKNFDDVIKALGLGADGVMLGNIINKSIESCGQNYIKDGDAYIKISHADAFDYFNDGDDVYKQFRGMSTKDVQKKWGRKELKTSEGIVIFNKVEYSILGWIDNFKHYLKSCMSYQGKDQILDFIGNSNYIFISQNAYNRFNK